MKDYLLSRLPEYTAVFTSRPRLVPTDRVVDAPITGNGDLGIVLTPTDAPPEDGGVEVYFTKNDFWKTLPGMDKTGGVKSLGRVRAAFEGFAGADYRGEQRLLDGVLTTRLSREGRTVLVTAWVPRQENLIVLRIRNETPADKAGRRRVRVRLDLAVTRAADAAYHESYSPGDKVFTIEKSFAGPELAYPTAAAAMTKVLRVGERGGRDGAAEDGVFVLGPGEEAVAVTAVVSSHDAGNYRGAARRLLDAVTPYGLSCAFARHAAWWRGFWLSSGVRLPTEPVVERYWYGSHYIMACCCGEDPDKRFPPGLFANWVTTDAPGWLGDYHLNYNYQAPWWGLYSSNKISLTETYDAPLLDYIPAGREAARDKLGCRGVYMMVGIGPRGFASTRTFDERGNDDGSYWGQKSNAAYAAVNMLMRFYATYDLDYARRAAYPFLRECGDFWEDYLVLEDGRYVIRDDCIHENGFLGSVVGWDVSHLHDYSDDFNSLLSLGLVRMVFQGLLDMSRELGVDEDKRALWERILEKLSPYPTQEREGKTVFRYTERGMDWCDGNTLGIQHVFPAGAVGLGSEPRLLEVARNTLEVLSRWEDGNGFPTFYPAAARLGHDPAVILKRLLHEIETRSYPNMYIFHGGGGIEDCSAVPTTVNEMLLQSHEGVLRFFPVWEPGKDAEFYQLRARGAFLVSARLRRGRVEGVVIHSEKGRTCAFIPPYERCLVSRPAPGSSRGPGAAGIPVSVTLRGGVGYFETEPGVTYYLEEAC